MMLTPGNVQVMAGIPADRPAAQPATDTLVPSVPSASGVGAPETKTQPFNLLLLGSDTREGQGPGFGSADVYTGARSDTAVLVHVSADRQSALVVSFPRDLRVDVPECGGEPAISYARFNAAFEVGGPACTAKVIEKVTGADINHIVVVDFTGFKTVVDAFGGVNVCLTEAVRDQDAQLNLPAGWQRLDGAQALALARARKSLSDGSDIARIGRQQALLLTAYQQVRDSGTLSNPVAIYSLLGAVGDSLTVSPSLATTATQVALLADVAQIPPAKIRTVTVPWQPEPDGETVGLDTAKAERLFAILRGEDASQRPATGDSRDTFTKDPRPEPTPGDLCGGHGIY